MRGNVSLGILRACPTDDDPPEAEARTTLERRPLNLAGVRIHIADKYSR
ncbi:MAG: hypothetical protein M3305_11280 [Actinomycetota bacterium]|nr:hypothetical protein [Actinomycetota bacterium]